MSRELTEYADVLCWCDIAHVANLTGVTVDAAVMAQAQSILSIITDVWPDQLPDNLLASDRRRLADALAYQAPWVKERVDLFAEVSALGVSQDGVSAQYPNLAAQYLAPLASVCLNRLSWNRASARVKPSGGRRFADANAARDAVLRDEATDTSGFGGVVGPFA